MPNKKNNNNIKKQGSRSARQKRSGGSKLPLTFIPPQSKYVNFVATFRFAITEAAAGAGAYSMLALNNPYDVYTAVGGPSPMGWTAMTSYYNKYRCDVARVRIDAYASGSANAVVESCLVPLPTNSTLPSSPENYRDVYGAVSQLTATTNSASGARKVTLDKQWNMWDVFGISRAKYEAEDNYGAVYNGNPVNTAYCAYTVYGWGGGGTAVTLTGKYTVSFQVKLFSPVAQNP